MSLAACVCVYVFVSSTAHVCGRAGWHATGSLSFTHYLQTHSLQQKQNKLTSAQPLWAAPH